MDEIVKSYLQNMVEQTVSALEERGFSAFAASGREEAKEKVLDLVPAGAKVGVGGSVTLRELGIVEALRARGHTLYEGWGPQQSQPKDFDFRKAHLTCDVFLTSSNAITSDGDLVNVDGVGNRVAAMIFGPEKVIVVAGYNKIVPDLDSAMQRIRNVAAPLNAKRLDLKVPCTETGYCMDCSVPDNICRVTTIISRKPRRTDLTVVLVPEQLGY
jgi:L-lactate utilization protein LutB